jgi:putative membrane protein
MKKEKLTLLSTAAMAVGAFLLLAPNAMAAEAKTNPNADTKAKQNADDTEAKSSLNAADTTFIQKEAAAGAALVRIGELGAKKAERSDIKAFAGMLADDHTKANAALATLADSKGVTLSTEVKPKMTKNYEKLDGESGANFDKEFLAMIISIHKDCVKNFEKSSENAEDAEVKSWATTMLPSIQAHLKSAEKLSAALVVKTVIDSTTGAVTGDNNTANNKRDIANKEKESADNDADNTARNKRDRGGKTLTPLDQGNNQTDTDTTAQIRKGILDLENISINAQNVKIITNEGHVTLRGPVKSEEEKRLIGEIANRIVTSQRTDNQLEVDAN